VVWENERRGRAGDVGSTQPTSERVERESGVGVGEMVGLRKRVDGGGSGR